ncbi:hypothetical protein [Actibacterium sp. 188UL27-1]|uniref:hypothetical protein n=1 Tax=Actibacterium sp. 188UL27-1 TaxID=2786961 RepID=UPI00195EEF5A|nr:hypothetical protein [Actibacterium sp. 188UL27-1]MBM7069186.1 hypothetical protein [Actibacterium sp. 188UL27-1]
MAFATAIYVIIEDEAHEDPAHTILPELQEREQLEEVAPSVWRSDQGYDLTIVPLNVVTEQRPYLFAYPTPEAMAAHLGKMTQRYGGLMLTSDPDTMGRDTVIALTDDEGLISEMRAAGFTAFAVRDAMITDSSGFLTTVSAMKTDGLQIAVEQEDAMFSDGNDVSSTTRAVPAPLQLTAAEPVPVALGYTYLVGTSEGDIAALVDLIMARNGAKNFEVMRDDKSGGFVAAQYSTGDMTLDIEGSDLGDWPYLDFPAKALVEVSQSFAAFDDVDPETTQVFDPAVRELAAAFGLCLVVEVAFDAVSGRLSGYRRDDNARLVPVDLALPDVEDEEDNL